MSFTDAASTASNRSAWSTHLRQAQLPPLSPKIELFTLYFIASTFKLLHVVVPYNPFLSKSVASESVVQSCMLPVQLACRENFVY